MKNANTVCLNGRDFGEISSRPARAHVLEVRFENDANCFAARRGVDRRRQSPAYGVGLGVILGTGVGGGGPPRGAPRRAPCDRGEWGTTASGPAGLDARDCYCGKRGCFEAHASGPALAAQYRERTGETVSASEIAARRARGDDAAAEAVIAAFLETFGRGLANGRWRWIPTASCSAAASRTSTSSTTRAAPPWRAPCSTTSS
ncbi:MAG: ROK family protein [Polyangiaceae bacterium]